MKEIASLKQINKLLDSEDADKNMAHVIIQVNELKHLLDKEKTEAYKKGFIDGGLSYIKPNKEAKEVEF